MAGIVATEPEPAVFVVDDDQAVRKSLVWAIESIGIPVEAYASPREFLDAYDPARPGCLVLDVRMPEMNGLELLDALKARGRTIPVIMITGYGEVSTAVRAMKGGAADFLEKPFSNQLLLERIQECLRQDARARREDAASQATRARLATLTRRERQVMALLLNGQSNKAVAQVLEISTKTVEIHRANVMRKMEAKSIASLVKMAAADDQAG